MDPMEHVPTLAEVERDAILRTLQITEGNRTHAARLLGISVRGLRLKLQGYVAQGHAVEAPAVPGRRRWPTDLDEARAGA